MPKILFKYHMDLCENGHAFFEEEEMHIWVKERAKVFFQRS